MTADSGCLRVIPGSQDPDHFVRRGKVNPNESQELFGVPPNEFPGNVALESEPGDVVIFNHDLYHASFGGSTRRRMFTMNCTRHATTEPEQKLAREYVRVHSPGGYDIDTGAGMYFPTMLDTADEKRMKHLFQPAQIHDELFPQFARDRVAVAQTEIQGIQTLRKVNWYVLLKKHITNFWQLENQWCQVQIWKKWKKAKSYKICTTFQISFGKLVKQFTINHKN